MQDNEIIKALERCSVHPMNCKKCPYQGNECCTNAHRKDALDLINRQKAKIKALQMDNKQLETDNFNANMNCEHLQAKIERLEQNLKEAHIDIKEHQAHIRVLKKVIDKIEDHINPLPFETDYDKAIRQAKAEAVKEFAEIIVSDYPEMEYYLDELRKDLLGGNE